MASLERQAGAVKLAEAAKAFVVPQFAHSGPSDRASAGKEGVLLGTMA